MERVASLIRKHLAREDTVFVFPSEIVASFWRRKSLAYPHPKAVLQDRFISWDSFKEALISGDRAERPVNTITRTLFCESILAENSETALFSTLIPEDYKYNSGSFLKTLRGILPSLRAFLLAAESSTLDSGLLSDLSLLRTRYEAFLEENRLYEPMYESPSVSAAAPSYIVFFPEVLEDFSEFESFLHSCNRVSLVKAGKSAVPELLRFANVRQEIRWLLVKIGELLDAGVPYMDIAITVPGMDALETPLLSEAQLRDIRLDMRKGRPLLSYPSGRFFQLLEELHSSGYALDAMKALFLNAGYPWKERKLCRTLIRKGIAASCIRNYRRGGKEIDLWKRCLKPVPGEHGDTQELYEFYLKLRKTVTGIVESKDAADLKKRLLAFSGMFFEPESWDRTESMVFQYALDIVDEIAHTVRTLPRVPDYAPFRLFLRILKEKVYVKRSEHPGIPVYDYRVSAGIYPKYHFLINATQENTRARRPRFPFLSQDQQNLLGFDDRDLSNEFLDLYCMSGEEVFVTCSRENFESAQLAAGYFITAGRLRDFETYEELCNADAYSAEQELWRTGRSNLVALFPLQRRGLDAALGTAFREKADDFGSDVMEDSGLRKMLEERQSERDYIRVSATALSAYAHCPFSYLFTQVLGVSEDVYEIQFENSLLEGTIIHRILQFLFERIKQETKRYQPEKLYLYREFLRDAARRVFMLTEREGFPLVEPAWTSCRRSILEALDAFIDVEAKEYPDYSVVSTETEWRSQEDEERMIVTGRIDRISEKDGAYVLVDYKRNSIPKDSEIEGYSEDLRHFQIPLYVFLGRRQGLDIDKASYYSVERQAYRHVYERSGSNVPLDSEKIDVLVELTLSKAKEFVAGVRNGRYSIPKERVVTEGCGTCGLRRVCRIKFVVR